MVAWTPAGVKDDPTAGQVEIGPWPDPYRNGWSDRYQMTDGACLFRGRREMEWVARVFIIFNTLVVRDGLDPLVVHRAFLNLKEYRERVSPDSPGLEDVPNPWKED
jgi:hypothetical protein